MIQLSLLQRAKQGDPDAIAALMNLSLESRGVRVHVVRIQACLHVSFISGRNLSRSTLVKFTRQGLEHLGVTAVDFVRLYGLKPEADLPMWNDQFYLSPTAIDDLHLSSVNSGVTSGSGGSTVLGLRLPQFPTPELSWQPIQPNFTALTAGMQAWVARLRQQAWFSRFESPRWQRGWLQVRTRLDNAERLSSRWRDRGMAQLTGSQQAGTIGLVTLGAFVAGGAIALMANSTGVSTARPSANSQPSSSTVDSLAPVRQAAAKKYLNKMTLAQQEFYRSQGRFARTLEELERSTGAIGTSPVSFLSSAYIYKLTFPNSTVSQLTATPRFPGLKSFTAVVLLPQPTTSTKPLITTLCESAHAAPQPPTTPQLTGDLLRCPPDSLKAR